MEECAVGVCVLWADAKLQILKEQSNEYIDFDS